MLKERVVTIKDLNTEDPINAGESKNDREGDKVNKTMKDKTKKGQKKQKWKKWQSMDRGIIWRQLDHNFLIY